MGRSFLAHPTLAFFLQTKTIMEFPMTKIPLVLALMMPAPLVMASTALSPAKDDIPEAQKIYSPYVERTVRNKNFAEGVYLVFDLENIPAGGLGLRMVVEATPEELEHIKERMKQFGQVHVPQSAFVNVLSASVMASWSGHSC